MEKSHSQPQAKHEGYSEWAAVGGYFDGDGCVDVAPLAYVLHWVISFSDNWLEQITQVREFLIGHGVRVGKPRRNGLGAWICEVAEISSLIKISTEMLRSRGIYKKRRELQLLLDYYSNKVTGSEVIETMNHEVRIGARAGKIRNASCPTRMLKQYGEAGTRLGGSRDLSIKLKARS